MIDSILRFFLTFVASSSLVSLAYPGNSQVSPKQAADKVYVKPSKKKSFDEDNMSLAAPEKVHQLTKEDKASERGIYYYHIYESSINFRWALSLDVKNVAEETLNVASIYGFSYTLPNQYSPQWELGFDYINSSSSFVTVRKKWTFNEKGAFRPFYSFGLVHKWMSDEQMASFTNWKNYLFLGTIGIEDVIEKPNSVRLELTGLVGINDIQLLLSLGWALGI